MRRSRRAVVFALAVRNGAMNATSSFTTKASAPTPTPSYTSRLARSSESPALHVRLKRSRHSPEGQFVTPGSTAVERLDIGQGPCAGWARALRGPNDRRHMDQDEAMPTGAPRALDERALRTIFTDARSANGFLPGKIPHATLERAVELAGLGPTSMNAQPVRYVFVESTEAKERLRTSLSDTNREKTMAAPVTAIVAFDGRFYEKFGETFPARPGAGERFADPSRAAETRAFARDNALIAMGYFIVAARAVGLDCGPMGGFDRDAVDAAFFADGRWASAYLINLGYDDRERVFPRLPRLRPADIARFA